jgi:hypothetical protein
MSVRGRKRGIKILLMSAIPVNNGHKSGGQWPSQNVINILNIHMV